MLPKRGLAHHLDRTQRHLLDNRHQEGLCSQSGKSRELKFNTQGIGYVVSIVTLTQQGISMCLPSITEAQVKLL